MGTHPIFESDFDCLTEFSLKKWTQQKQQNRQRLKRYRSRFDRNPVEFGKPQKSRFIPCQIRKNQTLLGRKKCNRKEMHWQQRIGKLSFGWREMKRKKKNGLGLKKKDDWRKKMKEKTPLLKVRSSLIPKRSRNSRRRKY